LAHHLQVLTEKAANRCHILIKYIAVLNIFAKAMKFSPKLCNGHVQHLIVFISDAVGILAILNKFTQTDRLTYTAVKLHIDRSILAMTLLLTTDGPHLAAMKKHLPTTPDSAVFEYKGHIIKDSA
ncbi:hypothetical protein LSAT2_010761, partial [Lamellibrachia satsuma]